MAVWTAAIATQAGVEIGAMDMMDKARALPTYPQPQLQKAA